jgi:hypothetical protein
MKKNNMAGRSKNERAITGTGKRVFESTVSGGTVSGGFAFARGRLRLFVVPVVVALLLSCTASVSFAEAGDNATVDAASRVTLTATQTDFTLPLSIDHADAFAGVELAVQCGDGVTIKSVDYSKDISHAGPTGARGLVWFTTFAGSNEFSGNLTATLHVNYEGDSNTSMVIDHAAFHTVDGSAFRTENVPLRKTVEIIREGSDYTPPPLEPPNTGNPPGAGNPPSGAGNPPDGTDNTQNNTGNNTPGDVEINTSNTDNPVVDNTGGAPQNSDAAAGNGETKTNATKTGTTKTGTSGSGSKSGKDATSKSSGNSASNTVIDRNTKPGSATTVSNSVPAAIPLVDSNPLAGGLNSATGIQNEQITSGDSEDTQQTSISSSNVPRAGGNANTMIPDNDISAMSTATLIMALACLAALAFLGFLFIKRKRDEKKKKDEMKEVM